MGPLSADFSAYRRVNAEMKRESYSISRMDEFIDSLREANTFPSLNANSGYWKLPARLTGRHIAAFTAHTGLYEFLRMAVRLINLPATIQRVLGIILPPYQ